MYLWEFHIYGICAAPGVGRKQNNRLLVEAALLHAFGDGLEPTQAKVESQRLGKLSARTCPKEEGSKKLGREVEWGCEVKGSRLNGTCSQEAELNRATRPNGDRKSRHGVRAQGRWGRKVGTRVKGTGQMWETMSMRT
jgi:hypothetical protein